MPYLPALSAIRLYENRYIFFTKIECRINSFCCTAELSGIINKYHKPRNPYRARVLIALGFSQTSNKLNHSKIDVVQTFFYYTAGLSGIINKYPNPRNPYRARVLIALGFSQADNKLNHSKIQNSQKIQEACANSSNLLKPQKLLWAIFTASFTKFTDPPPKIGIPVAGNGFINCQGVAV